MACDPNNIRLVYALLLCLSVFLAEIVVSRVTDSLTLFSHCAFMAWDVIAISVALVPLCGSESRQGLTANTFGWVRAEVMGSLISTVFASALCFTNALEALKRLARPHVLRFPLAVACAGVAGLLVNLVTFHLVHRRGSETLHQVRSSGLGKGSGRRICWSKSCRGEETSNPMVTVKTTPFALRRDHHSCASLMHETRPTLHYKKPVGNEGPPCYVCFQGVSGRVLFHVLSSLLTVASALAFMLQPCSLAEVCGDVCRGDRCSGRCWVLYVDPALCLGTVCCLLCATFPPLKEAALVLLQTVPRQVDIQRLTRRLMELDGVLAVHELHVWQLAGSRIIATAHVKCRSPDAYMEVARRIKDFFHDEGIHATTVQPEFAAGGSTCDLPCQSQCVSKLCCSVSDQPRSKREVHGGNSRVSAYVWNSADSVTQDESSL